MMMISRASATLVFGWLVLCMGVRSVDIFTVESLTESTVVTTPHPKTKFIMEIRITNRIYNDSLEDQESAEYKSLKQEVEQLFLDVYGPTSQEYLGTEQITFRNGSVIASAQLLFGASMFNPVLERSFFLATYKQIPSPTLDIDLDYVASINSVDMFAVETTAKSTVVTTIQPQTRFYMEIRITNRIYNKTLDDQESEEYKILQQEVTQLFFDVYSPTPLDYVSTEKITFRNGSVIAGADLLFGTTLINPDLERNLFISRYKELQSPTLAIDLDFVADEMPTQQPVEDVTTSTPTPTTTFKTTTFTTMPSTTTPSATTPSATTPLTSSRPTSTHPPTHTTSLGSSTVNTTHNSTSLSPTSTPLNTTIHPETNATHSPINITITTNTTAAPNATMPPSIHNITTSITMISSIPTDSPTTAGALVPGWGIALLVLAAISLLLLIILLIILLVMCCCWPNQKSVVREPEVITPPMYFNPDIPMYSTHSTIDSAKDKQVDVREKPPKNRTGMYVVNK